MKWTDYRELSIPERRDLRLDQFWDDCKECLTFWNQDFPDRQVTQERLNSFLVLAISFHTLHLLVSDGVPNEIPKRVTADPRVWTQTNGETFIAEMASLGPLVWGWRTANPEARRRGILQIIHTHSSKLDGDIGLWMDSVKLNGMSTLDAARAYVTWSGNKSNLKSLESIARVIETRVGRLSTR